MEGIIGVTYRCNAKCYMCNTWQYPTKTGEEITLADIEKIPGGLSFINITGGEPFLRKDIEDIVAIAKRKAKRVVISNNGYFTDRVIALARKNPDIGIRISIEGLPAANDELRGISDGFDHGIRTLLELKHMGMKDIGFGITVSDRNAKDLLELYKLACAMNMEFATAVVHNSYYFHKFDNEIKDKDMVAKEFSKLVREFFKTKRLKNWYRAYFNYGIINRIYGGRRFLPCETGTDVFFLDPFGDIRPCNALEESMGNIKEKSFDEIWQGQEAQRVRELVKKCDKECWMIGSASPAMKKAITVPTKWIIANRGKCLENELWAWELYHKKGC
ncbi:MAG: radical SAM protein [Candidatus Schekmanbacteria bacterium]|nr:radical SAM protein [Candidatus Schekmanbacteria bacterium]